MKDYIDMWKRLRVYDNIIEVWRTPTQYLVCYKYKSLFIFCRTKSEIENAIIKIREKLEILKNESD